MIGYFEEGDDVVTMAMNGWGAPEPAWWLNLQANPEAALDLHALIDGNKRLGWLATAVFLELNGQSPSSIPNDTVYELVPGVAAGDFEIDEIAERLKAAIT